MDFIDGKYELSDKDKKTVFYLFNVEESCNFATEKYEYTEFCDLNEQFCPACYSEIAAEIKTCSDEHQNRLMESLAKKQEEAFKDRGFHTCFRYKYCNHKYCSDCNEKIELKQDYVLVNPDNKEHSFSNVKQNYFVCSCNDFIYLPVVEDYVFPEQPQTSEDNTERDILSLDSIKKGYSLLKNPLSRNANTKIIKVNKNDIQDKIWFLSEHIPTKCPKKHPKLKAPNWNKIENMIRGYYEIWVKLNRNYSILDSLTPKTHSSQYAGDPLKWGLVSSMECTAYGFLDHSLKEDCATITISLKGVIRWRNEESSRLNLKLKLFLKSSVERLHKQKCVVTIISTRINSHSGSDSCLKMPQRCLTLLISSRVMPSSVSLTLSNLLGD